MASTRCPAQRVGRARSPRPSAACSAGTRRSFVQGAASDRGETTASARTIHLLPPPPPRLPCRPLRRTGSPTLTALSTLPSQQINCSRRVARNGQNGLSAMVLYGAMEFLPHTVGSRLSTTSDTQPKVSCRSSHTLQIALRRLRLSVRVGRIQAAQGALRLCLARRHERSNTPPLLRVGAATTRDGTSQWRACTTLVALTHALCPKAISASWHDAPNSESSPCHGIVRIHAFTGCGGRGRTATAMVRRPPWSRLRPAGRSASRPRRAPGRPPR